MASDRLAGILELDVAERILLAEEIWDGIAPEPAAVPLSDAQRSALDHRLSSAESDAHTFGWREVRRRLGALSA